MGIWVVSKRKFDVVRLKLLLENAISKSIIKNAVKLEKDGRYRIERILDDYIEGKMQRNLLRRLSDFPIHKVIDIVRRGFNRTPEEFKEYLKDRTIRKIFLVALKSLEKYGLTTPQNFTSPIMVVWNFTYRCNLRCKHCYQDAGVLRHGSKDEMTLDEKLHALEELDKENVPTIFFSGGEPLMGPHFWEIAEEAKRRGFYLSIASNGTLFANKENAQRAKEIGFGYIAVSLDASTPEKHDEFRGMPGMWERAVQGIKNLVDVGITTCIQFTITRDNIDELPKMFKLRDELGAYKVIVYNYIPVGRGDFENDPTPEQREEVYKILYEQLDAGRHVVASTAPQLGRYCQMINSESVIFSHYADAKAKELGVIADIIGGCGAGRAYCALQPDGRITPCVYMPYYTIGNIKEKSFRELWDDERMEYLRKRDDLWGHCAVCEYQAVCGGCRARGYAYFGDFKAPDPGCIFNKEWYYKVRDQRIKEEKPARAVAN